MQRRLLGLVLVSAITASHVSRAGELGIHIILSGEVTPGVYGQVQIGNEAPPPLVYAQPMLIEAQPLPPPPVYLHVPPGHARHWRRYCRAYNACNRPVYFVRSEEYEPGYQPQPRRHQDDDDHDHGRGRGHGHDRDHDRDYDRDHDRDRDYDHEHDREHDRDRDHDRQD